jgi:hypothetical protein
MTEQQPQRYFFLHIMKTAGTALRRKLINHFGEAAVYPTKRLDGTDPVTLYMSVDHLRERLAARGDQIRVITGHFPLRTVDEIDGRYTTLTLLRNPIERTLSYLRQAREDRNDRFLERRTRASQHAGRPLEAVYDDLSGAASNNAANNNMTRMLSLTPAEIWASILSRVDLNRDHLERAKEALAGIDAVGLQERFEDFSDLLAARFGWRLGEPEVVNPTAPVDVPETLRTRIAEDNALDVELYEFARELLATDDVRSGLEVVGTEQ